MDPFYYWNMEPVNIELFTGYKTKLTVFNTEKLAATLTGRSWKL